MIVLLSSERRSKTRTEPSSPTVPNLVYSLAKEMSYTALSWAMSCVVTYCTSRSQMVTVLSRLAVAMHFVSY